MGFTIPTKPTKPTASLERSKVLVFGPPKSGKSTTVAESNDPLFLATEPGLSHLEVRQAPIENWEDFEDAVDAIHAAFKKGPPPCGTVVVDTIDQAWFMCDHHVAILEDPAFVTAMDIPYGKGKGKLRERFRNVILKMVQLPCGVVFISHSRFDKAKSNGIAKIVSTLPDDGREIVNGLVDMILFVDEVEIVRDGKPVPVRVFRTRANNDVEAGCRVENMPPVVKLNWKALGDAFAAGMNGSTAKVEKPTKAKPTPPMDEQPATEATAVNQ